MTAEIFKTRKLWPPRTLATIDRMLSPRLPTFRERYYFRLVGDNGEVVAQSEAYTQKHNATEALGRYFPEWKVKDLT